MKANKTIANLLFQRNTVVGLSTILVWLMAAYGWNLALNTAINNYRYDGEISIPSFYLTLLVLPLPYAVFQLYKFLTQTYTSVDWQARLASCIFYLLLITLGLQGLFLCFMLFIGLAGGGLDIMFPWRTEIFLDAIFNATLWGMLVAFLTVLITFSRDKDRHFLLLSLPAVITYGIFFFKLAFLAGMSAKVLP